MTGEGFMVVWLRRTILYCSPGHGGAFFSIEKVFIFIFNRRRTVVFFRVHYLLKPVYSLVIVLEDSHLKGRTRQGGSHTMPREKYAIIVRLL
jgi:hypothetical protein